MSGKRKNQKKSNTPPPETGDFEVRDPVDPVESCVQELLHSMIKSFMDSVVTSINVRIDGVVKIFGAQLKASSLEFSQKDLTDHAEKIKSIEDNVSKIEATMKKHIEKTVYLENQSRRNNLRFEELLEDDKETWDETEAKVKNVLVEKLDFESAPEIERFKEHLQSTLSQLTTEYKSIFIMGDFNINLLNCESHPEFNDFLLMLNSFFFPTLYLTTNTCY